MFSARQKSRKCAPNSIGCARSKANTAGTRCTSSPARPASSNLFNKSPAFDRCLSCKPTLAAAAYLLGEIRVYSLNARNPLKGEGQQPLHSDVPRVTPTDWRVVNSMVMLDDMTPTNGPTRVVPGSHKWVPINVPDVNMAEVKRIEVRPEDEPIIPKDPYATASQGDQADRQGGLGRRHQRTHLAWRNTQREWRPAKSSSSRDRATRSAAATE